MGFICGIDEAGRGPVMGPMVIAGVKISAEKEKEFEKLGIKDSKKIQPKKREELYEKIISIVDDYSIIKLSPSEIDKNLSNAYMNLNWLEAITTIKILEKLNAEKAYIDCPTANASKYYEYLKSRLKVKTELVVEHKADVKYIASSAASILAKVKRDNEIKKLKKKYGDIGSGYPSDEKTKYFLEKNVELPIFRKSWSTWQKAKEKTKQQSLKGF
ncbi:MAG: ribonuclease HII [Candidatus Nanoarchaeia archaeon]